ncbi:hypothetical protein FGO68_gene2333 [Halteria grandinella]|uniref:Metallo-beta-lactamase domain-containing protein n=1 Tax=Halteria grandinella TaxID=5974 RepID=A0A8J8NLV6_HALGN|nr:hypothetical protein FGO68_gene2333 [Halteria grandinella]
MQLSKQVWLIPGENPGQGYLCGTNVYVVGSGKSRVMIDACTKNVLKFLANIKEFCQTQQCTIDRILITHGHHDHYAGAFDIVELLIQNGFSTNPSVFKFVDEKLETDRNRLMEHPEIESYLFNTRDGDVFTVINAPGETPITLTCVETPGHIDDHLCFLLQQEGEDNMLFTGDHIIGADSSYFTNYPEYLRSLDKVRDLTIKLDIKKYFVAHSYTLTKDDIMLDGLAKVEELIASRKEKDYR